MIDIREAVMVLEDHQMDESVAALILARLDRIEGRLDALEVRFDSRVTALDDRFLSRDVIEERARTQGERLGSLELQVQSLSDERKWVTRLVLTSVLLAVLGLVIGLPGSL